MHIYYAYYNMHNQGNLWASLKLAQAHFQRGSAHLKVLRQLPKRHFLSEPTKLPGIDFLPFPLHTVISTNSDAPWFDQLRAASTIPIHSFPNLWAHPWARRYPSVVAHRFGNEWIGIRLHGSGEKTPVSRFDNKAMRAFLHSCGA